MHLFLFLYESQELKEKKGNVLSSFGKFKDVRIIVHVYRYECKNSHQLGGNGQRPM